MPQQGTTLELIGSQTPTHLLLPADIAYSDVDAVRDIADVLDIELDQYQDDFLGYGLSRRVMPDGGTKWSAFENGIELSRQNGKSAVFEMRSLAGLYVFREKTIVYSAHQAETARAAYTRMVELVHADPELKREVWKTPSGNGNHSILLRTPGTGKRPDFIQELRFRTRTPGGGRGLTGDCVIIDEVQGATDDHIAALFPALSAKSGPGDPQIWYGGSAGTRKSTVLGRLVRRSELELRRRREGKDPADRRLLMMRFAADLDTDDPADPKVWAKVNPAAGTRITFEYIESEYRAMGAAIDPTRFAAERLGVGDYPRTDGEDWSIPRRRWEAAQDEHSTMVGPVAFSLEVRMDRSSASIVAAGWRPDGRKHIEAIAEEVGVSWAVTELQRLTKAHENHGVYLDPQGPAGALLGALKDANVPVKLLKLSDLTAAWGKFYDAFTGDVPGILHRGGLVLTAAMAAAEPRTVGGASTWQRSTSESSGAVIAATWAAHALDLAKNSETVGVSRMARGAGSGPQNGRGVQGEPRRYRPRAGFDPRTSGF